MANTLRDPVFFRPTYFANRVDIGEKRPNDLAILVCWRYKYDTRKGGKIKKKHKRYGPIREGIAYARTTTTTAAVYVFTSISSCLLRPFWQRPKLSKSDSLPRVRRLYPRMQMNARDICRVPAGFFFFFLLPINVLFTVRRRRSVAGSVFLFLSSSTCRRTLRRSVGYIATPRIKFFPSLTRKSPKRFRYSPTAPPPPLRRFRVNKRK